MSIDSVTEDLKQLEEDVRRLSGDSQKLATDVGDQIGLVEQEVVAAEYIAAEESMENIGSMLGMLSELNGIQVRQWQQLAEDHMNTLRQLRDVRSPSALMAAGIDHYQRRTQHVAEGITETIDTVATESRFLGTTLVEMWQPFFELVRRDWAER